MYPLHCTAGFPMPVKPGKFEIVAIGFKLDDTGAAYELQILDTNVNGIVDPNNLPVDAKRIFRTSGNDDNEATSRAVSPFCSFPEPIKTRGGIGIGTITNVDVGELYIYVR